MLLHSANVNFPDIHFWFSCILQCVINYFIDEILQLSDFHCFVGHYVRNRYINTKYTGADVVVVSYLVWESYVIILGAYKLLIKFTAYFLQINMMNI
jgi:hypothetical protein